MGDERRSGDITSLEEQLEAWEGNEVAAFLRRTPESKLEFKTASGIALKRIYTAADTDDIELSEIGLPGRYPYTRGPYPTMYRARPWTIRQVAGYGNPEATNARYKFMIEQGQTGLSTDFDLPTLLGYDSDDPLAAEEVGRQGVAIDTIHDVDRLFADIDLEEISVSMSINPTAWIVYAMYIAVAEKRGCDFNRLVGTLQADVLKDYIAQNEWIFPVRPSIRLLRDLIMYSATHTERFNPISLSGYHLTETGATAVQEIGVVMATTAAYCEVITEAGMDIDEFAPRLSFFFVSQQDFFEEICKFRAARRVYAKMMKNRFGAKDPRSMVLRVHVQTAAMSMTKAQPETNLMRTTIQALGAVLGGCQSMHTNGFDEAYAIPTEEAMTLAIRTQQIIRDETNVTSVVDPLGGSYFVEKLTSELEGEIETLMEEIEEQGGAVEVAENGWVQRKIIDNAYEIYKQTASGEKVWIGVNKYVDNEERAPVELHPYDEECMKRQVDRIVDVRAHRDDAHVRQLLEKLKREAKDESTNLMPTTIELVKSEATMGEICTALKEVWGTHQEAPVF